MKIPLCHIVTFAAAFSSPIASWGQGSSPELPEQAVHHAALGIEAAAHFEGFASLCDLNARIRDVNAPRPESSGASGNHGSARRTGHDGSSVRPETLLPPLPPMKVFDNLYFLGNHSVSAWLYGNENGYILIDALNTAEEAEKFILGGMQELGLSPRAIKYLLVTHAHGDHYGGATYLANNLGIDILMSEEDWTLADQTPPHPRFGSAPARGRTVVDGEILETESGSLRVLLTPGHTPGTISPLLSLMDGDQSHTALLWGGVGFNFGPNPEIFRQYAASAAKARSTAEEAGVDVFLSNHVRRDGSDVLMETLANRSEGEPHAFVTGDIGYKLFDVLEHCALAQAARFDGAERPK